MNDPADFLSRWSRRKRAAAEGHIDAEQAHTPQPLAALPADDAVPESAPEEVEFDLAKLPSIDSIGPETDVSAFLKPSVPASLRHAALRRAWVNDPAIRDFRAPQEMDWDFNAPGLPGFGDIGPEIDVKQMAARILGGAPPSETDATNGFAASERQTVSFAHESNSDVTLGHSVADEQPGDDAITETTDGRLAQRSDDIASQQSDASRPIVTAHRHGGALPK